MTDPRLAALLKNRNAQFIFGALGDLETRFVGGCVRDALLERVIGDMDLATIAKPEQVIDLLSKENILVIPTGIDHGTVTAVINKIPFEITTLRKDVTTDGRRATVSFSSDWEEDALRRDFTINAMSVDMQGKLYDYYQGQQDLKNKTLRFIGDATQRIREDYLRILRYFRFASTLDWELHDEETLQACAVLAPHLQSLSRERVQSELYKLLLGPGAMRVLRLMKKYDILDNIMDRIYLDKLEQVILLEDKHDDQNAFRRLMGLYGWQSDPEFIVLTREQKKTLQNMRRMEENRDWSIEKRLYFYGIDAAKDYFYLLNNQVDFTVIKNWQQPVFPLKAEDVFSMTDGPGPLVGETLKRAEIYWVDQQFSPTKQELLDFLIGAE